MPRSHRSTTIKDRLRRHIAGFAIVTALTAVGLAIFVYSGLYNIGADDHHNKLVFAVLQTLRDRSIQFRATSLDVPNLDDPTLVLKGAGQYAAMCVECHLAPGMANSELRRGMYPLPPDLSTTRVNPRIAFWTIKHGIEMSAMPAWGYSHDDPTIWSMVAFMRRLPEMSPEQYKTIVAMAPPDDDMQMERSSGDAHHD